MIFSRLGKQGQKLFFKFPVIPLRVEITIPVIVLSKGAIVGAFSFYDPPL